MLQLFLDTLDKEQEANTINDVYYGFEQLDLKCNEIDKDLVFQIDKGILIDQNSYIDRYGYKLYTSYLSAGSKAALCVLNSDKIVNLIECGLNARDIIISRCNVGRAFIVSTDITFIDYSDNGIIDVSLDNYHFTTIDRLNYYVQDERPYDPDLSIAGIEKMEA